jgi:glycosyltransferase involved in cell wall biosynthesis
MANRKKRCLYSGINYEKNEDCFLKTKTIPSFLLSGDPRLIPNPLVTIIIPTFKRPELLKDALNSVLSQAPVNFAWDILVIDNENYDGVPNEAELFIRRLNNPRVLYYRNKENLDSEKKYSPVNNWNRGVSLARGLWTAFLHDDDVLVKNYLRRIERNLALLGRKQKKLGCIVASYVWVKGEIPDEVPEPCKKNKNRLIRLNRFAPLLAGRFDAGPPTCGTLFRREALLRCGGFNNDLGLLNDALVSYIIMKERAVYKDEFIYGFYRCFDNISKNKEITRLFESNMFDFREYLFRKNIFFKFWGALFRRRLFLKSLTSFIKEAEFMGCFHTIDEFTDILG